MRVPARDKVVQVVEKQSRIEVGENILEKVIIKIILSAAHERKL